MKIKSFYSPFKRMKFSFFLSAILIFTLNCTAQSLPELKKIKSPEASVINKITDVPVSMYSGIASTSIPLYEINIKGVTVPITLDYTGGGGIKVDEEATMVGLGWRLNYGGSVSRNRIGKRDEDAFFEYQSLSDFFQLPTYNQDPEQTDAVNMMWEAKKGYSGIDFEPDEFTYNISGYSGKFMYKQSNSTFVLFPKEDIKVSYQKVTGQKAIESWSLLAPDGTKYVFGEDAKTSSFPYIPQTSPTSAEIAVLNTTTVNMWNLKKIITTNAETINYNYSPLSYPTYSRYTSESYSLNMTSGVSAPARNTININEPLLQSITFPGGSITFSYSDRIDLNSQKLDEIIVRNSANSIIKKIKFSYTYFDGNYGVVPSNYRLGVSDALENKRLKLNSLSIFGDDNVLVQNYIFDYYTGLGQLPSKYSFAQDAWGYFNGVNNTTWIPKYSFVPNGADRKVNSAVNNVFMLKSIIHPTKGKTEFVYESNVTKIGPFNEFYSQLTDSNFNNQTESLSLLGNSPNYTTADGERQYYKTFTVPMGGGYPAQQGWSGIAGGIIGAPPSNADCTMNYVIFRLEKLNSDGSYNKTEEFYKFCNQTNAPVSTKPMKWLEPGTKYRLFIGVKFPEAYFQNANLTGISTLMTWKNATSSNSDPTAVMQVGGLRIKEIRTFDEDGVLKTKKTYDYIGEDGYSSGTLYDVPRFVQDYYKSMYTPGNPTTPIPGSGPQIMIYGNPVEPIHTISGSYIGYENVTENLINTSDTTQVLKTKFSYSIKKPIYDDYVSPTVFLDASTEHHDWQFGKLLSVKYYKNADILKQEDYTYNGMTVNINEDYVDEIMARHISWRSLNLPGNDASDFIDNFYFEKFAVPPVWSIAETKCIYGVKSATPGGTNTYISFLTLPYKKHYTSSDKIASKTTTVTENGVEIKQIETYTYGGMPTHNQVTQTQTTASDGDIVRQRFYYPSDFASDPVCTKMVQLNMKNQIVKQENYKNGPLLNSLKTNFSEWFTNLIMPINVETQKTGSPLETRFIYNAYDTFGNILSAKTYGGTEVCYVYGYNNQYPIAEIKNASYTDVKTVLGGATAITAFSAQANPTDQQVTDFLAPLRSSSLLSNSFITSYTYKPLTGITTLTDEKGIKQFYSYDNMQRLKSIKDEFNRFLQEFDYHFKD